MKAMRKALIVLPLALALQFAATVDAGAVTRHWTSKNYYSTTSHYSQALKRCITVHLTGKMEYRWWRKVPNSDRKDIWIDRVRLSKPRMGIIARTNCHRDGRPAKLTKATLSQRFYDSKCERTTAIAVSAPFAVGVSSTKKCGRFRVAKRSSTYGANSSDYWQNNSGRPVTFKPDGLSAKPYAGHKNVCVRADALVVAYRSNESDSFTRHDKLCVAAFR
ncbi:MULTISPECIES: hypothetical protein [unclassified Streptomyces]|uniref:hypothetical protein n=1 Tax=unclassified Streptomyces TaxID=2593676 RepID=UPI0022869BBD|nr:hypothetical protein [Streptomyces sp. Je 1-369]WAL97815.1 hypothetical protein NOO62_26985 [Streptomyces sp. Je 1-369]